jgi:hypothetical protein
VLVWREFNLSNQYHGRTPTGAATKANTGDSEGENKSDRIDADELSERLRAQAGNYRCPVDGEREILNRLLFMAAAPSFGLGFDRSKLTGRGALSISVRPTTMPIANRSHGPQSMLP